MGAGQCIAGATSKSASHLTNGPVVTGRLTDSGLVVTVGTDTVTGSMDIMLNTDYEITVTIPANGFKSALLRFASRIVLLHWYRTNMVLRRPCAPMTV
jgi:hypothetical protein